MKKILVFLFLAAQITVYGQFPELAKTPPMGWNSWNAFDLNINSKIVKAVADSTGSACNKKDFSPSVFPVYFKLSKNSSTFTAYKSTDGKKWEILGDVSLNMPFAGAYLIGMEVCSRSSHVLNFSEFNQVKVEQGEKNS